MKKIEANIAAETLHAAMMGLIDIYEESKPGKPEGYHMAYFEVFEKITEAINIIIEEHNLDKKKIPLPSSMYLKKNSCLGCF